MRFYIKVNSLQGTHYPLFGKKKYFHQLVSIALLCENGNRYFAVSTGFDKMYCPQELIDPLPVRASGVWKNNQTIAEDIRLFISYNAGDRNATLIGLDCAVDYVLFCDLFGGKDSKMFPADVSPYMYDLRQAMADIVRNLPEEVLHGENYELIPHSNKLSLTDKLEVFESHVLFPGEPSPDNAELQTRYISDLYTFLQTDFVAEGKKEKTE